MVLDEFAALLYSCIFCMIAENCREMLKGVLAEVRSLQQHMAGEQLESGVQCSQLLLVQDIILEPWIDGVAVPVLPGHFVRTVML